MKKASSKTTRTTKTKTPVKKNKKSKKPQSFAKVFFKTLGKIALIAIPALMLVAVGIVWSIISSTPPIDVENLRMDLNSTIYYLDANGEPVKFEDVRGDQNRDWVEYAKVPQHMKDAFVAIEDERFFSHAGFDLKRTAKAVIDYLTKGSDAQGGSTITQQLVKNITGNNDRSPKRKVQEIWLAYQLEQELSKEQILELYMNTIHLANNTDGVQAAARLYFDKDVSDLSLAECASIAGITQYPVRYNPFINPENNKNKAKLVLQKMLELGKIDQAAHDEAVEELDAMVFEERQLEVKREEKSSYIAEVIIDDAVQLLVDQSGAGPAAARKMVLSGGCKIISTVDPKVQAAIDKVYSDPKNFVSYLPDEVIPQSAIVVMDPMTGYVKGLSGGLGERSGSYTLNRAIDTKRQPGSTIKPLSIYAPALEAGLITPQKVMNDSPVDVVNGKNWPSNQYNSSDPAYFGNITIQRAVEKSTNTIPVKILQDLGTEESYKFLRERFHIDTITEADKSASPLALGGLTNGVTVMDMTAAYATFANNGIYTKPITVLEIQDRNGNVIAKAQPETTIAMRERTAEQMHQMLLSVVKNGTGTGAAFSNVKAGGKTGSTDQSKDRWFVGYTPNYVAAVWFGYDEPRETNFSPNPTLKGWKAVMDIIMKDAAPREYATHTPSVIPSSSFNIEVCSVTGKLPGQFCIDHNTIETRSFTSGGPTEKCSEQDHIDHILLEPTPGEDDNLVTDDDDPSDTDSPKPSASPKPTATPTPKPSATPAVTPSHKPALLPDAA